MRDTGLTESERRLVARYGLEVDVRFLDLRAPRVRTRVLATGEGPPVLLVHGGGATSALWAPLMAELPHHSVVAIDRPGAGLNEPFDYRGVDLRAHAVSFLESALDVLGLGPVPILANSMGGLWSFWFALDRPELVSALVQLGCPALMFGTQGPFSLRFPSLRPAGPTPDPEALAIRMLQHGAGPKALERVLPEVLPCMYEAEVRDAHVQTRASMFDRIVEHRRTRPDMGLGDAELAGVRQPVLLVWGAYDSYGSPEQGRRGSAAMPNATVCVVPAGHFPWLDEPGRCGEAVRAFLEMERPNVEVTAGT
jgi:pimeloyl-ACP methyl ester carboxylesterase